MVRSIEGPPNTWTIQMQVADGLMVTALEKIDPGWGDDPDSPFEERVVIWDLESDPASPEPIGRYNTGGTAGHTWPTALPAWS